MRPEKENLFQDVLDNGGRDARRAATLQAGGRILRRRRRWRVATRGLGIVAVVVFAALGVQRMTQPRPPGTPAAPVTLATSSASFPVRFLSDDELLALFPDVPVGLATLSDGRKRLIFPRPGDEARFITYL